MNAEEYAQLPGLKNITIPKPSLKEYITERRFSMLDFFLLMCMLSIPSILYGLISHLMGVRGY